MFLTDDSFELFAAKHYYNPGCISLKEFHADLKRFKYIKRTLNKYQNTQVLNERLLLNHFILLHNVFNEAFVPMIFFKMEPKYWSTVKSFLVFLNYLPDDIQVAPGIRETDIPLDPVAVSALRKI